MFKHFLFLAVLIFSNNTLADGEWEYQVVFLPGQIAGARII